MKEDYREGKNRISINILLFILTFISTFYAGTMFSGSNRFFSEEWIRSGFEFSIAILTILFFHEMGHYIYARKHGIKVTLPYFIPVPFGIGTLGAIIKMKSKPQTRDALLEVGAAGPICGAIFSTLAVILGLLIMNSGEWESPAITETQGVIQLGTSYFFELLFEWIVGVSSSEYSGTLHPIAFAGWIGFLVTSINLLPVGQLDGGHILYALFGEKVRFINLGVIIFLIILGFTEWRGWHIWVALMVIMRIRHPSITYPDLPLSLRARWIGLFCIVLLILTFIPEPIIFPSE